MRNQPILAALNEFLRTDDAQLDDVRQDGRELFRWLVGSQIYHGRRPRGAGPVCVTIDHAGGDIYGGVSGPVEIEAPMVNLRIYAKDTEDMTSSEAILTVREALKQLMPQYAGPMGDRTIQVVKEEAEDFQSEIPDEYARDDWTRMGTITYMIGAERIVPTGAN